MLDPLALRLLGGGLHEGAEVQVDFEAGEFAFRDLASGVVMA